MHASCTTHLHAVKCIFRYLQGTLQFGLQLRPASSPSMIVAYSDADWVGCKDSCHSTTGCAVFFGPNPISWCSKKQPSFLSLPRKLSIVLLPTPLLKLYGFASFFLILAFTFPPRLRCIVITSVLLTWLSIRFNMIAADILQSTIILFVNALHTGILLSVTFLLSFSYLTFSSKGCLLSCLIFLETICQYVPSQQIEGA